jgi:hypothetical protein
MNPLFFKFIKKLALYTLIVGLIAFIAAFYLPDKFVSPALLYIVIFFFVISALTYYLAIKAFSHKTSRYANFFMITVFAKLMLYVTIIIIYAFVNAGDIVSFILTFFIVYFLFTIFETVEIFKAQKLK